MNKIAIVSDCGGQAMGRMILRTLSLFPNSQVVPFICDSLAAACGNLVDAIDAGVDIVLCNSAPRRDTRETNGDGIVYLEINGTLIVSTLGALGLLAKFVPEASLKVQEVNVAAFMEAFGSTNRSRFNFRGLEVIPFLAQTLRRGHDLAELCRVRYIVPPAQPFVWLVDEIEGRPTNLKLSVLRSDLPEFAQGRTIEVKFNGQDRNYLVRCYERLTDIPSGELGIYEGSSGMGNERFLEIALLGGSASNLLEVQRGGTPVSITPHF